MGGLVLMCKSDLLQKAGLEGKYILDEYRLSM